MGPVLAGHVSQPREAAQAAAHTGAGGLQYIDSMHMYVVPVAMRFRQPMSAMHWFDGQGMGEVDAREGCQ